MTTASYYRAPVYDPHETRTQFSKRQQRAFAAFEPACRDGKVRPQLQFFYDDIVRRVGANRYAWPAEATLAAAHQVSISTIKRWLRALEQADLIHRERQFASSSRTFITAYEQELVVQADNPADTTMDSQPAHQHIEDSRASCLRSTNHAPQTPPQSDHQPSTGLFFGLADEPAFGSFVSSESIKPKHLSPVVGNTSPAPITALAEAIRPSPAIQQLLEKEEVDQFFLAPQLECMPFAELQAISYYLNHQHRIIDRPRLFAALARDGFGAQLIQSRTKRASTTPRKRAMTDPQRYVSGPLRDLVNNALREPEVQAARLSGPTQSVQAPPPQPGENASSAVQTGCTDAEPIVEDMATQWQAALDHLQRCVPPIEFTTWFQDTMLVALDAVTVVIGTPTVFGRDQLLHHYYPVLQEALQVALDHQVQIDVVITG
jgi:DNA-binding transcriptional regulator YhcF (GntR family)